MEKLNWYETFKIDENINEEVNDIISDLMQDYRNHKKENNIK